MFDALARARVWPVAQLGGIGFERTELALQDGGDVDEPIGSEGLARAGRLPFGAGRHLEAEQCAHRVPALAPASGDDRLMLGSMIEGEITGMVGENRCWPMLRARQMGLSVSGRRPPFAWVASLFVSLQGCEAFFVAQGITLRFL